MNIVEALQSHAEAQATTYLLNGRMMYPDEVFGADGFLPLIGRMAERRLARVMEGVNFTSGFSYLPVKGTLFAERIDVRPCTEGAQVFEDSLRLAALVAASADVVGLGIEGTLDLTPVYAFFTGMAQERRDTLSRNEEVTWPLYQPVHLS
jgi:hypothetical protein